MTAESPVWIIDTDYENYAIINGCDHVSNDEKREVFWIVSRHREIQAKELMKIEEVLRANNFENDRIIRQRHGADM